MTLAVTLAVAAIGQQVALEIPKATWPDLFFGTTTDLQSIRGRTFLSNLPDLQKKRLPDGVLEVRIWEGFGVTYLEGYRLRRENGQWRGWWIQPALESKSDWKSKKYLMEFKPPKQGWDKFWADLTKQKITTLPDFEALPGKKDPVRDGVCYVVEYVTPGFYRTYMYDNPQTQTGDWPELKNVRAIVLAIHDAFRDQTIR